MDSFERDGRIKARRRAAEEAGKMVLYDEMVALSRQGNLSKEEKVRIIENGISAGKYDANQAELAHFNDFRRVTFGKRRAMRTRGPFCFPE